MSETTEQTPAEGGEPATGWGLDGSMTTSIVAVAGVAVALSVGALALFGWRSALGVALGGLVATANLWLFALIIRGVLQGGRKGRLWSLAGFVKLLVLLGAAFYLLRAGLTGGLTIAVGYAALPVGIALGSWLGPRVGEDEPPPTGVRKPPPAA
jgi:hypothetical protein